MTSKLTFQDLEDTFLKAGFRLQPDGGSGGRGLFFRRIRHESSGEGPVCLLNHKLSFHIHVYEDRISGHPTGPYRSVTFDITGEYREDSWTKLTVYSVPWEKAIVEFERIQTELLAAWDAVCKVGRT